MTRVIREGDKGERGETVTKVTREEKGDKR